MVQIEYTNRVYRIVSDYKKLSHSILMCINNRALEIASLFKIYNLPEEYKIPIFFCEWEKFNVLSEKYGLKKLSIDCLAFTCDAIYVIEYDYVKNKLSETEYIKIILHECVHILQHIATGLVPNKAIWLYESIACFLSDQKGENVLYIPPWHIFLSNFYSIKNCYSIAYMLGEKLIKSNNLGKILLLQDNLTELEQLGHNAYSRLQKRIS